MSYRDETLDELKQALASRERAFEDLRRQLVEKEASLTKAQRAYLALQPKALWLGQWYLMTAAFGFPLCVFVGEFTVDQLFFYGWLLWGGSFITRLFYPLLKDDLLHL